MNFLLTSNQKIKTPSNQNTTIPETVQGPHTRLRDNDIKHSRADTVKAYKQLDFEARTALSDGIRRVVQEAITAKSGKLYPRDGKVRKLNT